MQCHGTIYKKDLDTKKRCYKRAVFQVNNRKVKKAACRGHLSEIVDALMENSETLLNVRRIA